MRFATNRVPVLAQALCTLAVGCAALLGLPTSASAGTILQFGQQSPTDTFDATVSGSTLTLTTPVSIPITITQIGNLTLAPGQAPPAFETFVGPGLTSSEPQSGNQKGGFSGTVIFSSQPNGLGTNILTASFTGNGIFSASGFGGSLFVPDNVTLTSAQLNVIQAIGGTTSTGSLALSFVSVLPFQSGTFTSFTSANTGLAFAIPEPASIVMASFGLLGVLGYGTLRHRSSKA